MTTLRCDMARSRRTDAFTLVEVLVSIIITALIVVLAGQLMKSATAIATSAGKHIDTDVQARAVLDRMAVDFAKMLKRTDVDYYIKAPIGYKNPNGHNNTKHLKTGQPGNDQIAFFSQVPGYYNNPPTNGLSPLSLVAYRINAGSTTSQTYLQLERMGKGLLWNGVNNANSDPYPIVFLPGQIAAATGPWANNGVWYGAINNDNSAKSVDPDYAQIGPQVFRLEYYYLLKDGSIKDVPVVSWNPDPSQTVSAKLNAFADVEAIVVAIAVIDPASRLLLYNSATPTDPYGRLFNLMSDMADFKNANGNGVGAQKVGDLENQWNAAIQHAASTGTTYDGSPFPAVAAAAIRVYNRYFDLKTPAGF
jgi:type II secretory pathway component PulJ